MANALIPMADGFEDLEAVSVIDVLRRGGVEVVTASVHDRLEVRSAHGITVRADALFTEVGGADYNAIVLPGGAVGTANLLGTEFLAERLVRQRVDGHLVCAICAAPTILSKIGLLTPEHHVTCYPSCAPDINCLWADQPVIEHDRIITGRAPGSAVLFALVVLKALVGEKAAQEVARGMVFDF